MGWIYVVRNSIEAENVYKIGLTENGDKRKLISRYSTGTTGIIEVIEFCEINHVPIRAAEEYVFRALSTYRVGNTEHFQCDLQYIQACIEVLKYNTDRSIEDHMINDCYMCDKKFKISGTYIKHLGTDLCKEAMNNPHPMRVEYYTDTLP
jgi:hypothetical protein